MNPEEYGQVCAVYRSEVSRRVAGLEYLYCDDIGGWKAESALRETSTGSTMPEYLKIIFRDGGETVERIVRLNNFTDGGIK